MREIPLTQGRVALIDEADFDWLNQWKWHYDKGYATRTSKKIFMHRVIMRPPLGMVTDHINGNGLDNRRSNLRLATVTQNCQNARIRKDNTSFFKGVYRTNTDKWRARIQVGKKRLFLGDFSSAQEAAGVYITAALEFHGEFARAL